ncbi:MAG: acyl-ACP--UDP-N-acetylglucosamine O-acyltransferase [Deltaproteobacteria bacterium]|nr:acyl-ACP--UDP-N-acetylglucosamine O-acyltransferase [Deltaproteobacteria bacterium]
MRCDGIHALALVDPAASLGENVSIGPFALVGAGVVLEAGCSVASHAVVQGDTAIGPRTTIGVGAVIGGKPQMRGLDRAGKLQIGAENRIGEYVTIHRGGPEGCTRVGDANLLMAYVHIAHDCIVGSHNEIANSSQLAGHVEIADHVTIGGQVAVHQEVRVGRLAMIGGGARVSRDILPFACASGDRARVYGINALGLRRAGFSTVERTVIRHILLALLRAGRTEAGLKDAEGIAGHEHATWLKEIEVFLRRSQRGLAPLVPKHSREREL